LYFVPHLLRFYQYFDQYLSTQGHIITNKKQTFLQVEERSQKQLSCASDAHLADGTHRECERHNDYADAKDDSGDDRQSIQVLLQDTRACRSVIQR
jgi:hypothetical protein